MSVAPGCRFCRANGLLEDTPEPVAPGFFLLGSLDPTMPQSVMIVPERHMETPFDLKPAEWAQMPQALAAARARLRPFDPEGFTIGWNVGPVAGQTVAHVHLHVIARRADGPGQGQGIRGLLRRVP